MNESRWRLYPVLDVVLAPDNGLNAMERLVVIALAHFRSKKTGLTFPSLPSIAAKAGVDEKTVRRILDGLTLPIEPHAKASDKERARLKRNRQPRGDLPVRIAWEQPSLRSHRYYTIELVPSAGTVSTLSPGTAPTLSGARVRASCPPRVDFVSPESGHSAQRSGERSGERTTIAATPPKRTRSASRRRNGKATKQLLKDWSPDSDKELIARIATELQLPASTALEGVHYWRDRHLGENENKRIGIIASYVRTCLRSTVMKLEKDGKLDEVRSDFKFQQLLPKRTPPPSGYRPGPRLLSRPDSHEVPKSRKEVLAALGELGRSAAGGDV